MNTRPQSRERRHDEGKTKPLYVTGGESFAEIACQTTVTVLRLNPDDEEALREVSKSFLRLSNGWL